METPHGNNTALASEELLQTNSSPRGDRRDNGRRNDWFTKWVLERRDTGKNVLAVLTGELGIGKSYMGLGLCRWFDPSFSMEKVVFLGSDFMKAVKVAEKGSWILFDEPNLGIGHRSWMNIVNRTVAGFVQASRFLGVNALFALPSADLMDTAVVRVAHLRIRVTSRGWGKVERIKHSEYEGGPRIRFKGMGTIKVALPPVRLTDAYETKRREFHSQFFKPEGIAEIEHSIMPEKRDYLSEIIADPVRFSENGKLDPGAIMDELGVKSHSAYALVRAANHRLNKKQSSVQS